MISRVNVLEGLVIVLWMVRSSFGVPPEYCLQPLNTLDCGDEIQPVFTYYKPRSLCEIEFWRGCPTYNRFEDEVTCSHVCIGRLGLTGSDYILDGFIDDEKSNSDDEDKNGNSTSIEESCHGDLNQTDCNKEPKTVYTYDHKRKICTKAIWKGCKTTNKYHTELRCMDLCMVEVDLKHWDNKIKNITKTKINDVNKIVDDIILKIDKVITSTTTTQKTTITTTQAVTAVTAATAAPAVTAATAVTEAKIEKLKHTKNPKTTQQFKIPDSFWSDKESSEEHKKDVDSEERVDEVIIALRANTTS